MVRPGFGPRPRMFAAAAAARFAMRHRMPTIASVGRFQGSILLAFIIFITDKPSTSTEAAIKTEEPSTSSKDIEKGEVFDERAHLMKDLDTRIVVQVDID